MSSIYDGGEFSFEGSEEAWKKKREDDAEYVRKRHESDRRWHAAMGRIVATPSALIGEAATYRLLADILQGPTAPEETP